MEGATAATCEFYYRACAGYPDRYMTVADSCASLVQSCSAIGNSTCTSMLDIYQTGSIDEATYLGVKVCMATEMSSGSSCDEGFTYCSP
jgi:hypothetical protein